jgi:Uma2 family endonuclease
MTVAAKQMTAEELIKLPRGQFRYELIEGKLITMSPAGHHHGKIAMRIGAALNRYVEEKNLGVIYAAEIGFKLRTNPDTVRAPDAAFVTKERVEAVGETSGYFPGAPDLAVEVVSPDDAADELEAKTEMWLEAGARLVWFVYPKLRAVTVHRSRRDIKRLVGGDMLDGEDGIKGFRYALADLFA